MRSSPLLRSLAMGAASGLLMLLSMPPFRTGLVAWVCLVPLLFAVQISRSGWQAFLGGWTCGLVFFGGCVYWTSLVMTMYGGLSRPVAWAVTGLFVAYLSLFPAVFAWAGSRVRVGFQAAWLPLSPLIWVACEYLRTTLFTGFPWCLLGYSQHDLLAAAQVASIGGIYAVSAVVALGSVVVVTAMTRRQTLTLALAGIVVGTIAWGRYEMSRYPEPGRTLRVGLVQPCTPPIISRSDESEAAMRQHLALTARLHDVDLVVWPENSLLRNVSEFDYFRERLVRASARAGAPILVNSIEDTGWEVFNSTVLVTPAQPKFPRYDKIHLVPFGEYVPLRKALFFAGKILNEVSDFSPGRKRVIFDAAGVRVASAICYEIIYPGEVVAFVRGGAELLVTQSNDSWYGNTGMPHQHQAMAAFRSIENRRYLVRATNSGISSVVDAAGRTIVATALGDVTAVAAEVRPSSRLTLYARSHDLLARACVLLSGLLLGATVARRAGREIEPSHIISGGSG